MVGISVRDELVRSVDRSALPAFYRRYERLILGYLLRRTRNAEVAADLTAEVVAHRVELALSPSRPVEAVLRP